MKQVLQNIRSGDLEVMELPEPLALPGELLIANVASLISAGTEKSIMGLAKKSLIGKARSRQITFAVYLKRYAMKVCLRL